MSAAMKEVNSDNSIKGPVLKIIGAARVNCVCSQNRPNATQGRTGVKDGFFRPSNFTAVAMLRFTVTSDTARFHSTLDNFVHCEITSKGFKSGLVHEKARPWTPNLWKRWPPFCDSPLSNKNFRHSLARSAPRNVVFDSSRVPSNGFCE